MAGHLAPWARDAVGIGLVVLALLATLALWFDAAGVAGRAITYAIRGSVGVAAMTFPILALYWGVLLLRGTAEEDRVRMFIGFAIAVAGALGLFSLARGNPSPASGYHAVHRVAGLVGAVMAWPLSRVISIVGAGIVGAGLTVLGLLIFTGTPLSAVWEWVRSLRPERDAEEDEDVEEEEEEVGDPGRHLVVMEEPDDADAVSIEELAAEFDDGLEDTELLDEDEDEEDDELAEEDEEFDYEEDEDDDSGGGIVARPRPRPRPGYKLPPLELLRKAPASAGDSRDEDHTTEALERTFRTFGVAASVPAAHRGPTVTLFEVEVEAGTKVSRVLSLADDIAYALATPDVRIIAPIPGRSAIGVEVPNRVRDFVTLGDVLRSKPARDARAPLTVGLGKDVHGQARVVDLSEMPHVLIAGATGAGKSSLINAFITSILMRTDPDDVKLVLIDPKRVELSHFADLPHLLSPVIVHPKRAAEALNWVVREMETRYESFATIGIRDIRAYRAGLAEGTLRIPPGQEDRYGHLPYMLVVVDELADLMMVAPRDVEDAICRIAQMARAVGIHLVVATQRPSVDVVTGLIKANIPSRIAFMTSSQADSRVILDINGAEKLVGHGDMLFAPSNISKPVRLQGAWVTEKEIEAVTEWIRSQREPEYATTVEGLGRPPSDDEAEPGIEDELLDQAAELVVRSQLGSTSMLQRKLKVGFARAGRLMDLMEDRGIVGPGQGSKARDVLITPEEWEESRSTRTG
ncbi:MAG: DNA translocase FtsK [Actinomycetota bacterium]|nr:DNA translocase FtsK [Actinomycetota bacterium]